MRSSVNSRVGATVLSIAYKTEDADTLFVSLGCAAENIEEACDYLREQRNAPGGSVHINVIRPFPEASGHRSAARQEERHHVRAHRRRDGRGQPVGSRHPHRAQARPNETHKLGKGPVPALSPAETPRLFNGSYGIGSRDFRPEHTLGAYEFATGQTARKDGKRAGDGVSYFTVGIDHPYSVISKDTPSLAPARCHRSALPLDRWLGHDHHRQEHGRDRRRPSDTTSARPQIPSYDEEGILKEKLFIMANPNTGRRKRARPPTIISPLVAERIRVNCELNHVDVVLCCDPKAFTHTNPLAGVNRRAAALIWESDPRRRRPPGSASRSPVPRVRGKEESHIRILHVCPGLRLPRQGDRSRRTCNCACRAIRFSGHSSRVSTVFCRITSIEHRADYVKKVDSQTV